MIVENRITAKEAYENGLENLDELMVKIYKQIHKASKNTTRTIVQLAPGTSTQMKRAVSDQLRYEDGFTVDFGSNPRTGDFIIIDWLSPSSPKKFKYSDIGGPVSFGG